LADSGSRKTAGAEARKATRQMKGMLTAGVGKIVRQPFPLAPRRTYILPDGNRQDALASFIRSCSGQK
jgi:hypothetical protein